MYESEPLLNFKVVWYILGASSLEYSFKSCKILKFYKYFEEFVLRKCISSWYSYVYLVQTRLRQHSIQEWSRYVAEEGTVAQNVSFWPLIVVDPVEPLSGYLPATACIHVDSCFYEGFENNNPNRSERTSMSYRIWKPFTFPDQQSTRSWFIHTNLKNMEIIIST